MKTNTFACLVILAFSSISSFAGENTKEVDIRCGKYSGTVDQDAISASAKDFLKLAMKKNKMDMDPILAMGELDTMLTSYYGLRKPLASIVDKRAVDSMSRTAQLVMSGYPVAAQMSFGLMKKEGLLQVEQLRITGNMIYTLLEPTEDGDDLRLIKTKVQKADEGIKSLSSLKSTYAKWILRGYAYNDPVAVDVGLSAYCMTSPTKQDNEVLRIASRNVRLDPRNIDYTGKK